MNALAILGSPRMKMNTDTLLDNVIEGLTSKRTDVEKVILKNMKINPCIACGACEKTGKCFMKDDMEPMYEKFNNADIIIIASPMYFNSVNSLTKSMIDRCQAFWSSKYILNNPTIDRNKKRRGLFICVAGASHTEESYIGATIIMDLFFKAINTSYDFNLLVDETDKSFVGDRVNVMDKAFSIGQQLSFRE